MMWRWQSVAVGMTAGVAIILLLLGQPTSSFSQQDQEDPLQDPLVRGAWLYEGNCVRCHGPYEKERVGRRLDEDELIDAMEGGAGGCFVDWGTKYGGPFRARDLKAVALYIATWEELGQAPELPPLPPQPTPTPVATPTPSSSDLAATPTPTPTPTLDPAVSVAIQGSDLALGAWIYTQNCHRCHLSYEQGRMGRGLNEKTIQRNIRQGKVGTSMPAFGRREGGDLRVREIRALVGYIQAWEALRESPALPEILFVPPTPDPADLLTTRPLEVPPVAGDPQRGARLYSQHCTPCHGNYGEGGIGSRLAKAWPSVRPDLTIRAAISSGVPGSLMPAWEKKHGGSLATAEIDDLVALLLQWQEVP